MSLVRWMVKVGGEGGGDRRGKGLEERGWSRGN